MPKNKNKNSIFFSSYRANCYDQTANPTLGKYLTCKPPYERSLPGRTISSFNYCGKAGAIDQMTGGLESLIGSPMTDQTILKLNFESSKFKPLVDS